MLLAGALSCGVCEWRWAALDLAWKAAETPGPALTDDTLVSLLSPASTTLSPDVTLSTALATPPLRGAGQSDAVSAALPGRSLAGVGGLRAVPVANWGGRGRREGAGPVAGWRRPWRARRSGRCW